MKDQYEDMMELSRPISKYPRMEIADRAKIFAPFSALKGYEEAVREQERLRVSRPVLSEEEEERLNRQFLSVRVGDEITVVYFDENPGPDGRGGVGEGEYVRRTGVLRQIDIVFGYLIIGEDRIPFCDVVEIS